MVSRSKIVAGIDVGSSKVATIIAQVTPGEDKINVIGASSINSAGVRKGQIVNIEEASQKIIESVEAAERMAGFSINRVFVSVGGAHISSQNSHGVVAVTDPEGEISKDDVARVLEAARAISLPSSREILHVIPRTFTVDSQEGVADPVGMSGVRLEVETHIVTGSTTSLRNLTKCVSEVGADIDGLVFSGIVAAKAVLSETEKELGVILADIGGGTTSLVIFVEGSPAFTSVLPVGAKNVTNDLAIGLRISLESAEKLKLALIKKEFELSKKNETEEDIKESDEIDLSKLGIEELRSVSRKTVVEGIIRPRLNEIFTMIGTEIQKSGFAGMTPSGVVLCGGGALTIGAVESCKRTLALPVRIGVPTGVTGLIDDILSPVFAAVLGLIIYGENEEVSGREISLKGMGKVIKKIPLKGTLKRILEMLRPLFP